MAGRRRPAGPWIALVSALAALPAPALPASAISAENALPGDSSWRLVQRAAPGELEAYASAASVNHGEPISIHARSDAPHTVRWRVYRMGWYGGREARLLAAGGPVPVVPQPVPAPAAGTGLVECAWPETFTVATGPGWTSGVHLVVLTRDDGPQTWAIFVVRDDERKGAAVVQASFTTYQAYNPWGGTSLYVGGPAQEVSFDRPFAEGNGAGQYFRYEHELVKWAEARGFDLVYVTDLDLDRDPSLLGGQKLFLSVGHDEYWTRGARDALEAAIAGGLSAAFLSANSVYWQIRLEPSRRDPTRPRRTQVCYKAQAPARDPLRGTPDETVQFRDPRLARPENALLGVMYSAWLLVDAAWVVTGADAWIYEGTGLADGDAIPGIVGYETDRTFANGATPVGTRVLAHSPVVNVEGRPDWHEAALRETPAGGFVFSTGTIEWAWGLAREGVADPRVQRITENVLLRAGLVPGTDAGGPAASPAPLQDHRGAVSAVDTLAGAAFEEGLVDGPATAARFRRPTGLALDSHGDLYVADTGNHAVRRVRADAGHTVETIAGDGVAGELDGAAARLRLPQGIAVAPDGTVYVADTGNHRIVRLQPAGARFDAETFAGDAGWNGFADGLGTEARFTAPAGLALVGTDLYVADRGNHAIRKVTADGRVTTLAGDGTDGLADGPGRAARFRFPGDLAGMPGALLVLDSGNRVVRRVALDGEHAVTTVAGDPDGGFADGSAGDARFMPVAGMALAGEDLLVADGGNARVRRIRAGEVSTAAGSGLFGAGDGAGASARLAVPAGLALRRDGAAVVADQGASTLRLLVGAGPPVADPPPAPPPEPPPAGPPPEPGPTAAAPARRGGGGCGTGGAGGLAALAGALLAGRRRGDRGPRAR